MAAAKIRFISPRRNLAQLYDLGHLAVDGEAAVFDPHNIVACQDRDQGDSFSRITTNRVKKPAHFFSSGDMLDDSFASYGDFRQTHGGFLPSLSGVNRALHA